MGITFENVSYQYPDGGTARLKVLDSLSIQLAPSKLTAVLGAPGSGKSTLLQLMNGLLLPEEGRIHIFEMEWGMGEPKAGKPSRVPKGLRKRVGLVFQYPEQQLYEENVLKDLCFGPLNFGASAQEAEDAARQAAKAMGLDEILLARSPFQLSSGQMRKAAMAAVLAADPDVLVLDEPTASLDPASREELMGLLQRLCSQQGKTIVFVTHRLEEALLFADECVVIGHGQVIYQGMVPPLLSRDEILEEAGLVIPASVRLLLALEEQLGPPPMEAFRDPGAAADWILSQQGKGQ